MRLEHFKLICRINMCIILLQCIHDNAQVTHLCTGLCKMSEQYAFHVGYVVKVDGLRRDLASGCKHMLLLYLSRCKASRIAPVSGQFNHTEHWHIMYCCNKPLLRA